MAMMNQYFLAMRFGIAVTLSVWLLHDCVFGTPIQANERTTEQTEKSGIKKEFVHGNVVSSSLTSMNGVKIKSCYLQFRDKYPKTPLPNSGDDEQPPVIELNKDGSFKFERLPKPMLLYCESADGKLVGSAQLNSSDTGTRIELRRSVAVRGTLRSHETNEPLSNQRVIADVRYRDPEERIYQSGLIGAVSAVTDENGKFEISGLVADRPFDLRLVSTSEDNTFAIIDLGTCATNKNDPLELGEFNILRSWFAHEATPRMRLQKAIAHAQARKQNVLVIFSSSNDPAFKQFSKLRQLDEHFQQAMEHFRIVAVDLGGARNLEANKLAEDLGVKPERDQKTAHFCLLDSRGRLLEIVNFASSDTQPFSQKLLLKALVENAPQEADAQELFKAALKLAESESKLVFLQESGPNCSPCVSLHRFLTATRDSWSVDFVWLELDRRWSGTDAIMQRIRGDQVSTIPWYAILDHEGNVLSTSFDKAKRNIGYPGSPKSRTHFFDLLKKHGKRMTDDDFAKMELELDK